MLACLSRARLRTSIACCWLRIVMPMHFIYSCLARLLVLRLLWFLSCGGAGLRRNSAAIVYDIYLISDHDASVLVVCWGRPLLWCTQTVWLKGLLAHKLVAFGTFAARLRCDCRGANMLLVLKWESILLAKRVQCSGAYRLNCIVTRVSSTFLEAAAANCIVTWVRLRILLHHPAESALVHRLNELRLDWHLGVRAMLVNEINTWLLSAQIVEINVMEDLIMVVFGDAASHVDTTPLVRKELPLIIQHILLLLLQLMRCLLQVRIMWSTVCRSRQLAALSQQMLIGVLLDPHLTCRLIEPFLLLFHALGGKLGLIVARVRNGRGWVVQTGVRRDLLLHALRGCQCLVDILLVGEQAALQLLFGNVLLRMYFLLRGRSLRSTIDRG